MSRMWQAYNTPPEPPQWVGEDEHPPPVQRPTVRERIMRARVTGNAVPDTINPPSSGRVRRDGQGAQSLGWLPDAKPMHSRLAEIFGPDVFDEPPPIVAPAATAVGEPGALHEISVLARALNRGTRTIRDWEKAGIIPPPRCRTEGVTHAGVNGDTTTSRRMYTTEEIEAAVSIARDEGVLNGQTVQISTSGFPERVAIAWQRLRDASG